MSENCKSLVQQDKFNIEIFFPDNVVLSFIRAFFSPFGTMTHTPGIGNFNAKIPKIGNFLVLLAILSNHNIHHIFI